MGKKWTLEQRAKFSASRRAAYQNGTAKPHKHTEATKQHLSEVMTGKPGHKWTDDEKQHLSEVMTGKPGHKWTDEEKAAMRDKMRALYLAGKAALAEAQIGKPEAEAQIGKPEAEAQIGKPEAEAQIGKPEAEAQIGKPEAIASAATVKRSKK